VLKIAVNIHRTKIPNWAEKFLNSYEILDLLQVIKVTKRQIAFDKFLNDNEMKDFREEFKINELVKTIYINKKGDVVFYWNTPAEKTMFFLKWG
jgi:hypothetical protein